MDIFKIYKRRFRLEDGELWYRIDGFYDYTAFAARSGLSEERRQVHERTGVMPDFATFVAERGVRPLLAPHVRGEVRLCKANCGRISTRYFKGYIKERDDFLRLQTNMTAFEWPEIKDQSGEY